MLSAYANVDDSGKTVTVVIRNMRGPWMGVHHRSSSHRLRPTAKKLLLIAAVLAIASGLLAACGGSKDPVVGTWNAVSSTGPRVDGTLLHRRSTVEFFEDGTLNLLVDQLTRVELVEHRSLNVLGKSGNWSWSDDDSLRIEFSDAAYVLETTLDGDELIVRDRGFGGNAVVTFARDLSKKPAPDR